MTITIPGIPIAKKRPRFARRGKFVVTYNDQETEEGRFYLEAKTQWKEPMIEGPLKLYCSFAMPIPKGTSQKKIDLMLEDKICHTKRPDLDNLLKFSLDVLRGLVYRDDSQITALMGSKFYSLNPETQIKIEPNIS